MTVGFLGGKFLPLHLGHVYMIMAASNQVDKLYVVLSSSPNRDEELCQRDGCKYIPAEVRMSWIGEVISELPNVEAINIIDDQWDADYDWEEGANQIKAAIPETITHVFSSEPEYDKYFSEYYPGAEHVVIDPLRKTVDISATRLRQDIYGHWDMLPEAVKPFFVKKVAIVGTESCGKSTLANKLAKLYGTNCVDEVGRDYCEKYSNQLTVDMFDSIAMDHYRKTEDMMRKSNKMIFIDSEAVVTRYYLGMYAGTHSMGSDIIDAIIAKQNFDLVLYLEPDVPWVPDGFRFAGEDEVRKENNKNLKNMFARFGIQCIIIEGDYKERFDKARKLVDDLME